MQPYSGTTVLTGPVAPVDDTPLGDVIADTAGVHPGIDLIREGLLLLATDHLPLDRIPTILATLAGGADGTDQAPDLLTAIGHLVARLSDPAATQVLLDLPEQRQKDIERQGEQALYRLTDPWLREPASEAAALIDGI
ncbi:hypothetical protein ACH4NI_35315 [Streptomyces olivaceus]|uniref:hypothetical protein n=1 Tax=Streptomyces TaxID=1883 RepID=UPI002F91886E|nr:hypothetical protein OH810_31950 [Streptomyces albidoflavus]